MTEKHVIFSAEMKVVESAPASVWIQFPWIIREVFGKGRVKVHVRFDDKIEFRGTLAKNAGVK